MSVNVELPDALARRLEAEAAHRGVSVEQLAIEAVEGRYGTRSAPVAGANAIEAFIGCASSGRTEAFDIRAARADLAARKLGEGA